MPHPGPRAAGGSESGKLAPMQTPTRLASDHGQFADPLGAVVPPVYQNSTFVFDSWDAISDAFADPHAAYLYSRGNNPTVRLAETKIADLCGGDDGRLFASGMGAIAAVAMHCLSAGGHAVLVRNVYGPTRTLFQDFLRAKLSIEITEVDGRDPAEFAAALRPGTQLIYLESPTSNLLTLQDLAAVSKIARTAGVPTAIDNSWASPIFQRPLDLGIDYEIHSCTKYLGGHSDLLGGVVVGSARRMRALSFEYLHLGATMAPTVAAMLLRSLRTLPLRMAAHAASAAEVARFLSTHPKVETVRYPGLEDFPQADLAAAQMSGSSGLMSIRLKSENVADAKSFVDGLSLFGIGVSWGGHESLVYVPAISYSREHPADRLAAAGISLRDIRLSIGLEAASDLIEDLRQALATIEG